MADTKISPACDHCYAERALFERHDEAVITIRLPLPPSMNRYWRTRVVPGRKLAITYVSAEGKAYKDSVKAEWLSRHKGWTPEPLTARLRLLVLMSFPTRRKCDLDNRLKPLQDAMQYAAVYEDDSQIDDLRALRGPLDAAGGGFVDVIIETIF